MQTQLMLKALARQRGWRGCLGGSECCGGFAGCGPPSVRCLPPPWQPVGVQAGKACNVKRRTRPVGFENAQQGNHSRACSCE
eukprot:1158443-Pelagomonas_calceolata.AAC.17